MSLAISVNDGETSMKAISLSAGLLAVAMAWTASPVSAADLDYRSMPPPDRYGSAYDDPRYKDIYGPEPRRGYTFAPEPYRAPRERAYDRYADGERGCLPRHVIERRLANRGWSDFHDVRRRGGIARVKARRDNGDLFVLRIDRCSGEIIQARLIDRYGPRPYAHRGDSRFERRYW
ncbi:MAG: hypothetical protein ACK5JT_08410 [Hyphomicrobiaceae bacterium]